MKQRQKMTEKNYLKLKPEDLEWARRRAEQEAREIKIDQEQLYLAEFGRLYGYEAIKSALNNEIDSETMAYLVEAGRKLRYQEIYNMAQCVLIGCGSAMSKKPSAAFEKATNGLKRVMRADI